ncbi:MAG: hypothetical protein V2A73_20475 [Pseudomonadota bacterium]
MEKTKEIEILSLDDLDVQTLEERLEMVAIAAFGGFCGTFACAQFYYN